MADPVVDEIKRRVDIAVLVEQSVQLKKTGRYLKGLCPFHREKTPSFVVYPEQGTYHCFGCGQSGDVFTWVQETEHLDFGDALRRLAARAGVALPKRSAERAQPADAEAHAAGEALATAAAWYHERLLAAPDAAAARDYLAQRGLKRETLERFGLGWAPDRRAALVDFLTRKGFAPAQIEAAGLARAGEAGLHDLFRGRVLFPIRDAAGTVCGFGGRVLGDGQPQYLNSPQTRWFDKGALLYGIDLARPALRTAGCAVIVEGYMDVVVPHQEGFANVVASLGTALGERQIELLKRYTTTIVLALDADAAGQAATLRGLEVARQALFARRRPVPGPATRTGYLHLSTGQLKIATLHGGKDPDEIVREDPQAWRRLIESAVPMMEHKLELELARVDLSDPRSKAAAVQELARFLVQVPDQIEWGHYVDQIAQRLRLDVRAVQEELARASRAQRQAAGARGQGPGARSDGQPWAATGQERGAPPGVREGPPSQSYAPGAGDEATRPGEARAASLIPDPRPPTPVVRDVTEEHLVTLLVLAPELARRMPARLTPEDFRQPECRELYRAVLRFIEGKLAATAPAPPEWPGAGAPVPVAPAAAASDTPPPGRAAAVSGAARTGGPPRDDPFRPNVDAALRDYYDAVMTQARRRPPQTPSQLEADLAGVVRRIRERNLRAQLLEAQYMLAEAGSIEERVALERHVERLAAQLGRVQLERSRVSLYTSPAG